MPKQTYCIHYTGINPRSKVAWFYLALSAQIPRPGYSHQHKTTRGGAAGTDHAGTVHDGIASVP